MKHILLALLLLLPMSVAAQQLPDLEFNTKVENPAYDKNRPRVLFDEAHNNFHTTTGRYKPFADLLYHDGYQVVVNRKPFNEKDLDSFKVLVIANALGAEDMDDEGADQPAFTEAECDAVFQWIKSGGSLLLIADHKPYGSANEILAKRFAVDMSKGFTYDLKNSTPNRPSQLIFSKENKLLASHPITMGRSAAEQLNRVVSFTGQSLKGPEGSFAFLQLADSAVDRPERGATTEATAAGRAQGIALKAGKGRVVILGEAAMLTAQIAGPDKALMGMNVPGNDDKQLALNIMHWLSGLLKEK